MAAERARFVDRMLARFRPAPRQSDASPPLLPLLEYVREPQAADWLCTSVTTFSESVASFLPGHFEAYARIYHPFGYGAPPGTDAPSWRELPAAVGVDLRDTATAEALAYCGAESGQARIGSVPEALIGPLVDHLRRATTTPARCFFAAREGFGNSAVPRTLELPHRRYHVFTGPIGSAHTNLSANLVGHQSANLWWPADQAWCVAIEIDFVCTYVGERGLASPRCSPIHGSKQWKQRQRHAGE